MPVKAEQSFIVGNIDDPVYLADIPVLGTCAINLFGIIGDFGSAKVF